MSKNIYMSKNINPFTKIKYFSNRLQYKLYNAGKTFSGQREKSVKELIFVAKMMIIMCRKFCSSYLRKPLIMVSAAAPWAYLQMGPGPIFSQQSIKRWMEIYF